MARSFSLKGVVISVLQYYGVVLSTLAITLPLIVIGVMIVAIPSALDVFADPISLVTGVFLGVVCLVVAVPIILLGITGDFFLLFFKRGWFAKRFGPSSHRTPPPTEPRPSWQMGLGSPPHPPWFAGPGEEPRTFSHYPEPGQYYQYPGYPPPYPVYPYPTSAYPGYYEETYPPATGQFSQRNVRSDSLRAKKRVRIDLQLPRIGLSLPMLIGIIMLSLLSYLGMLIGNDLGNALGILLMLASSLFFIISFFLLFTFPPIFWFEVVQRGKALIVQKRDMLKAMAWGLLSPLPVLVIVFIMDLIYHVITGNVIHEYINTAVTAPIVEELCKAAGLALLVKRIRNPYDGLLLGFCAGAGFSVCENFLYFTSGAAGGFSVDVLTGFTDWAFVAIVRTVMAVQSHALGTGLIGFGIGYYLEGKRRGEGYPPAILFGYMAAVALHAAWNGSIIILDAVMPKVLGDGILSGFFTIGFIICFFLGELFILLKTRKRSQALEEGSLKRPAAKEKAPAMVRMT